MSSFENIDVGWGMETATGWGLVESPVNKAPPRTDPEDSLSDELTGSDAGLSDELESKASLSVELGFAGSEFEAGLSLEVKCVSSEINSSVELGCVGVGSDVGLSVDC